MEQYYFKSVGQDPNADCIERCMVKDNGTMIGSAKCQQCKHHKGNNKDEFGDITWIKCERINDATNKTDSSGFAIILTEKQYTKGQMLRAFEDGIELGVQHHVPEYQDEDGDLTNMGPKFLEDKNKWIEENL